MSGMSIENAKIFKINLYGFEWERSFFIILISLYVVVKRSTKLQQHTDFKKPVKSSVLQVSDNIVMNLKRVVFFVVHDFLDNRL